MKKPEYPLFSIIFPDFPDPVSAPCWHSGARSGVIQHIVRSKNTLSGTPLKGKNNPLYFALFWIFTPKKEIIAMVDKRGSFLCSPPGHGGKIRPLWPRINEAECMFVVRRRLSPFRREDHARGSEDS
jgi:hypothetical protein